MIDVSTFQPIADGVTHPLSQRFSTLAAAQSVYPHATALTDEIDWAASQAAITWLGRTHGGTIHFPPGTYFVNRPILFSALPYNGPVVRGRVEVNGYGAVFKTGAGYRGPIIAREKPANQAIAKTLTGDRFFFRGLSFVGGSSGAPDQIGLELNVCCRSVVEDCDFINLDHGILGRFCLSSQWVNCSFTGCRQYPIYAGGGDWDGATPSNSQSNHLQVVNPRFYCAAGSKAAIFVRTSSGVVLDNAVIEGASPDYGVLFDDAGSTVVKNFYIRNLHLETDCKFDAIKISLVGGFVCIDGGYWPNSGAESMVNFVGGTRLAYCRIRDVSWWKYHKLRGGNPGTFILDGIGNNDVTVNEGGPDFSSPAGWHGGVVGQFTQQGHRAGNFRLRDGAGVRKLLT